LGDDAVVETAEGAVHVSESTLKAGEKITVHYTEAAGKKAARVIHKIL
jgi:hypothetical protein